MHSSNRICTFGTMTLIPPEVSRGVGSMQSTGQKGTQASQPVQLSGITTAISFGFFFFRVIFAGASGMIAVGLAFFASYPAMNNSAPKKFDAMAAVRPTRSRLYHVEDYARFRRFDNTI